MRKLLFVWMLIIGSHCSYSAEFAWFNVFSFDGWVENSSDNNAGRKKIWVMPKLYGPGLQQFGFNTPDTTQLIAMKPDGSIVVKFELRRDLSVLPPDFKTEVYKQVRNLSVLSSADQNNVASNFETQFATAKNIRFSLLAGDKVLQSKVVGSASGPNSITGTIYRGEFDSIPYDNENYSDIRNGQFKIEVSYVFPYSQFSSVDFKLTQTALTRIQVDTFKQVIQQSSSSGGSFLFFNFRNTYVRNIERERVSSSSSAEFNNNLSITIRDPDENTIKIFDEFMGIVKLSREKFLENHKTLSEKAFAQNNPTLGKLCERYINAVEANDTSGQVDVLKAAAALAQGDVLSFMAAGVRFSESSSSGSSTYIGNFRATVSSQNSDILSAAIIKTVDFEYTQRLDTFSSLEFVISQAEFARRYQIFGTQTPTPAQVASKFADAVRNNNLTIVSFCLANGVNPNEGQGWPLITATQNKNVKMVEVLLKAGANPNLKNVHGESALVIAQNDNLEAILALLNKYKNRRGSLSLLIKKTNNVNLRVTSVFINKKEVDWPFKNQQEGVRSELRTLYPANYELLINAVASLSVPTSQLDQQTHYRFLQTGFGCSNVPNVMVYYKPVEIYGLLKSVDGITNEYSYDVDCNMLFCGQRIPAFGE